MKTYDNLIIGFGKGEKRWLPAWRKPASAQRWLKNHR